VCSVTYLLGQGIHLLRLQTSVCEHTDLRGDVAPVVLAAKLLEVLLEKSAHADDTIGHALDLAEPLLVEGRVVEDFGCNACAVDWWVGVQRSHEDLDLRVDPLLLLGRLANHGESTHTLTIQTLAIVRRGMTWYLECYPTMFFAKL
jgi:hypothetical protein